jgi:hypothetical protein
VEPIAIRWSADDVDGDAQIIGRSRQEPADVGIRAEPEGPTVEEPGHERFRHEKPAAVTGGEGGRLVEERSGVNDLEDVGVGVADDGQIALGKGGQTLGQLPAAGGVDALEEAPVTAGRQG